MDGDFQHFHPLSGEQNQSRVRGTVHLIQNQSRRLPKSMEKGGFNGWASAMTRCNAEDRGLQTAFDDIPPTFRTVTSIQSQRIAPFPPESMAVASKKALDSEHWVRKVRGKSAATFRQRRLGRDWRLLGDRERLLSTTSSSGCNGVRMGQELKGDCNGKDARTAGEVLAAGGFRALIDGLELTTQSTGPAVPTSTRESIA